MARTPLVTAALRAPTGADMLEHQETQHDLSRRAEPTAAAALRPPLGERLVNRSHNLLVGKYLVGMAHPVFAKITDFLGNKPIAEAQLCPPHLNHVAAQPAFDAALDAATHD